MHRVGNRPDLLASSGDHLRVWRITSEGVTLERLLANVGALMAAAVVAAAAVVVLVCCF